MMSDSSLAACKGHSRKCFGEPVSSNMKCDRSRQRLVQFIHMRTFAFIAIIIQLGANFNFDVDFLQRKLHKFMHANFL